MPHDGGESSKAFYRLFNYIDGSNDADSKIPMTAPVSMRIVPGEQLHHVLLHPLRPAGGPTTAHRG